MIGLLHLHLNRFSRALALNTGATRANANIPLTMLRYIRGMELQISPFPPFRGRDRLIAAVDAAMTSGDPERITADLQLALQEAIADSRIELPECVHRPVSDHYARRPLYHSREHGYSVIAMSWGPGQGTPLHDHDAMWCVEGVWSGELEITRYELLERTGERLPLPPPRRAARRLRQCRKPDPAARVPHPAQRQR